MTLPTPTDDLRVRVAQALRDVPDFPKPGILFKDITPVLADPLLMREVVTAMCAPFRDAGITHVVAVESRGFLFGMPMALELGIAFAPARKPGKLPWHTVREEYSLEYRSDVLEMHEDALALGGAVAARGRPRVLVVDDVLATGGTAAATCRLVERLGGEVQGVAVLVELGFLGGRSLMPGREVSAILTF
ncbi:adenine phosphoribosyltransferase [Gemmatimonas sp.]|jgi:adenine phosphoribosyltransferase|uniref:adenine phosphoribosyltransferase n=1 Tax=Gemmatimonas sp. TaxID=1962908 RepID=UPI0037BEF708